MREAIRWALILSALGHVAIQAYSAWHGALSGRHAGLIRAPGDPRHVGSPSLTGCYLAIVLPLAPLWAGVLITLGVFLSGSWLAVVALSAALALSWPYPMGGVPIVALSAVAGLMLVSRRLGGAWRWAEWLPRGDSLDSVWLRFRTWRVVSLALLDHRVWPWGRGWGHCGRDLRRYQVATGVSVMDDHAFNEYLEVVYELGIVGVLACLLGVVLLSGVVGREPFGMSLMVWALTMTGSLTLRTWPFPFLGLLLIAGACAS